MAETRCCLQGALEGDMTIQMFTRKHKRRTLWGWGGRFFTYSTSTQGKVCVRGRFPAWPSLCIFCRSFPLSSPHHPVQLFQLENLLLICFIVLPQQMTMQDHELGSVTILDALSGFNLILRSQGSPYVEDIELLGLYFLMPAPDPILSFLCSPRSSLPSPSSCTIVLFPRQDNFFFWCYQLPLPSFQHQEQAGEIPYPISVPSSLGVVNASLLGQLPWHFKMKGGGKGGRFHNEIILI